MGSKFFQQTSILYLPAVHNMREREREREREEPSNVVFGLILSVFWCCLKKIVALKVLVREFPP